MFKGNATAVAHSQLSKNFLSALTAILGKDRVLSGLAEREAYAWDNTGYRALPDVIALAESTAQVAAILPLCNQFNIPVIPRGAGTGNVGGALASQGGLVLSTQRMNRILEISPEDRLAVVEPGVVNADLQKQLAPLGLFWPPDPSSARSCTVGGNLAMCSAGPGAVRFGVTRDWVLGISAILVDGTEIHTGGRTTKGVVGYDLTRLLVGSEGTLAVITQAILKLAPMPARRLTSRAVFYHVEDAARAVSALMSEGEPPSALEFLDSAALDLLRKQSADMVPEHGAAMLLLEVAGGSDLDQKAQELVQRLARFNPIECTPPVGGDQAAKVWAARSELAPILRKLAPKRINEDVVVPVSRLAELIRGLQDIAKQSGIPIVNFGHAGNGNIHVNLLVDPADLVIMATVKQVLDRVFRLVLDLDGTLSGEHGVGTQKRHYVPWEQDEATLGIQKKIKLVFDPKNILNPGKLWP